MERNAVVKLRELQEGDRFTFLGRNDVVYEVTSKQETNKPRFFTAVKMKIRKSTEKHPRDAFKGEYDHMVRYLRSR